MPLFPAVRTLTYVMLVSLTGCFPYYGLTDSPIPRNPFEAFDAETGATIPRVLVVPRYVAAWVYGSGFGEGPGGGTGRTFLRGVYVHNSGAPLAVPDRKSAGIVWGPGFAFTGKGEAFAGLLLAAPGYSPRWIASKSIFAGFTRFPLTASVRSSEELANLVRLLMGSRIEGSKQYWGGPFAQPIEVDLTTQERDLVREFLLGS